MSPLVAVPIALALFTVARIFTGGGHRDEGSFKQDEGLAVSLARKWGKVFNLPPQYIQAIMQVESDYRPSIVNRSPRALRRGGAWGLMQMTADTAPGEISRLRKSRYASDPSVKALLPLGRNGAQGLLNPDFNVMLSAFYLKRLLGMSHITNFRLMAAAYHQGPNTVRRLLKADGDLSKMGKYGTEYVRRAMASLKNIRLKKLV